MSEKSHVSMEQHACLVCTKLFDTGAILLDKRLQASMDNTTVTGWGLCPEHQAKWDEGYIALVEATPGNPPGRTGRLAHIRREAWGKLFDVPPPSHHGKPLPLAFIEPEAFEKLAALATHTDNPE